MTDRIEAIRARKWDSPDALPLGDLASARIAGEDIVALLAEVDRLRSQRIEDARLLHIEINRRDEVIAAMAAALFEKGPDELDRLCKAQRVYLAWNSARLASVAPDAEPGGAS